MGSITCLCTSLHLMTGGGLTKVSLLKGHPSFTGKQFCRRVAPQMGYYNISKCCLDLFIQPFPTKHQYIDRISARKHCFQATMLSMERCNDFIASTFDGCVGVPADIILSTFVLVSTLTQSAPHFSLCDDVTSLMRLSKE